MSPKEILKAMYDAFATGNIPFILETISEDFTWKDPCDPSVVPYGGLRQGRKGMMNFFQAIGNSTNLTAWEVTDYVSEGDTVIAEGKHGFQSKKTGKGALLDWAMVWKFKDGVPVAGQSYYNTADCENAFREN
ncbi:MAG TPA: nuclear transport factor 2 family protein [Parafilimonas sp.]|nr:nuclear transport factor 2 family protein [Parafilimonas sp.]